MIEILTKALIKMYLIIVVSVFTHEMFHFMASYIIGIPAKGLYIGSKFLRKRIGKLYFSPLVNSGFVEIDTQRLLKISSYKIVFFFLSGSMGNFILAVVPIFIKINFANYYFFVINSAYVIACFIPFVFENNDIMELINILKLKKLNR